MNYAPPSVLTRPSSPLRLLLVDQDPAARQTLRRALEARIARPLDIREAEDATTARQQFSQSPFDAAVIDLNSVGGTEGFATLVPTGSETVIYAAGQADAVGDAVAAVRLGAADFLEKPLDGAGFARRIERHFVTTAAPTSAEFEGFVGQSQAIRTVFEQTLRIAGSEAAVLITGEPGTGKALLARAVHRRSRRRTGPFMTVSCAGLSPEDLTSALSAQFEGSSLSRARGGTLFIDDVDALDIQGQSVLFRFMEGGDVAGIDGRDADVRVISAANISAEELVSKGRLRTDLLFRLAVLPLHVPPLRERTDDILALAEHFLARLGRSRASRIKAFDAQARRRLIAHDWPGNGRELQVVVQRLAMMHAESDVVTGDMVEGALVVPTGLDHGTEGDEGYTSRTAEPRIRPLWMEERRIIESAITAYGGNIARAAAALEISPSTIYRKRQSWEELAAGTITMDGLSRAG